MVECKYEIKLKIFTLKKGAKFMSNTSKIVRSIIAGLMVLLSVFGLVVLIDGVYSILFVELGGLAALGLYAYFAYGIPLALATIIYQIVLIVKRKFWILDFIPSLLLIIVWASLYLSIPIISIFL